MTKIQATAAGTGPSVPLLPVALIIIVMVAAAGGDLYLKSRQGKEER